MTREPMRIEGFPLGTVPGVMLPAPHKDDLDLSRAEQSFWECRFCGAGERSALTLQAELWRELAHEARCRARHRGEALTPMEIKAVDTVWRPALLDRIEVLWWLIHRAWADLDRLPRWMRPLGATFTRRRVEVLRTEAYRLRMVGDVLGLPCGWATDVDRREPVR